MTLSAEQIEQIRRNKERALQIRAEKERQRHQSTSVGSPSNESILTTTPTVPQRPQPLRPINGDENITRTRPVSDSNRISIDSSDDCMIIGQTSPTVTVSPQKLRPDIEVLEVENGREAERTLQPVTIARATVLLTSPQRTLTDEQKMQIERNRQRALQIREEKMKQREIVQQGSPATSTVSPLPTVGTVAHALQKLEIERKREKALQIREEKLKERESEQRSSVSTSRSHTVSPQKRVHESSSATIVVKFSIADSRSMAISFSPFHEEIAEVLHKFPRRHYNKETRITRVLFSDWKRVEEALIGCKKVRVTVECDVPEHVRRILTGPIPNFRPAPSLVSLPQFCGSELIKMAYPYQIVGIQFSIQRNGRVLIADDMGLGKTVQALGTARYFSVDWPLVIICPASVTHVWRTSIDKFLGSCIQPDQVLVITKSAQELPPEESPISVIIMSYDQMVKKESELKEAKYGAYIFDESHMLKNADAARTKTAAELARLAKRVILLSGTPALSCPAEMFTQIQLVDPQLFPTYSSFVCRYCDGKQGVFGWKAKGCSNCEELCAILFERVMIRRLKKDVLDLPEKSRELIILSSDVVDTNTDQLIAAKEHYEKLKRKSKNKRSRNYNSLLKYYGETGVVKAEPVAQQIIQTYCSDDTREKQKIIVFAHHKIVLDTIQEEIAKKNLSFIRIDGKTPVTKRGKLCEKFQEDPECQVAILSISAASVGITLTAASVVVFAELYWTPGTLHQGEDRVHRIGQDKDVLIKYLIAQGTADDEILDLLQEKMNILGKLNLTSETFAEAEVTLRYQIIETPGERDSMENEEWADDDMNPVEIHYGMEVSDECTYEVPRQPRL